MLSILIQIRLQNETFKCLLLQKQIEEWRDLLVVSAMMQESVDQLI